MIVVDSSVWIDFLNGRNAPHVRRLRAILGIDEVIVGDLMLCEVLQGLESEQAARDVLALPMFPELTDAEIQRVVESIAEFYS